MVFIHSINKFLLSPYYMTSITLDPGKTEINQISDTHVIYSQMGGERVNKSLLVSVRW